MTTVNYSKSLEQLENDYWGEPDFDSYVVTTCHSMRKKPLSEVTVEELRLVIGQGFSLDYLIPMAIELLKINILTEGNLYEGDLLANTISKNTFEYWQTNKSDWELIMKLIEKNKNLFTDKMIIEQISNFQEIHISYLSIVAPFDQQLMSTQY